MELYAEHDRCWAWDKIEFYWYVKCVELSDKDTMDLFKFQEAVQLDASVLAA